jgi:hypothetical protein
MQTKITFKREKGKNDQRRISKNARNNQTKSNKMGKNKT